MRDTGRLSDMIVPIEGKVHSPIIFGVAPGLTQSGDFAGESNFI